jgi:hypothetical protein
MALQDPLHSSAVVERNHWKYGLENHERCRLRTVSTLNEILKTFSIKSCDGSQTFHSRGDGVLGDALVPNALFSCDHPYLHAFTRFLSNFSHATARTPPLAFARSKGIINIDLVSPPASHIPDLLSLHRLQIICEYAGSFVCHFLRRWIRTSPLVSF